MKTDFFGEFLFNNAGFYHLIRLYFFQKIFRLIEKNEEEIHVKLLFISL